MQSVADVLLAARDHSMSMELHISCLQQRIAAVKALLDAAPPTPTEPHRLEAEVDQSDDNRLVEQVIMLFDGLCESAEIPTREDIWESVGK